MRPNNKKIPIKWFLFAAFVGLSTIFVSLLWLFQILFLPAFYDGLMQVRAGNAAEELLDASAEDGFADMVQDIAEREHFCVNVYIITEKVATQVQSAHMGQSCLLHHMGTEDITLLYEKAVSSGGEYHERMKRNDDIRLVTIQAAYNEKGEQMVIFLDNAVEPVVATTEILRVELGAISVFMLLLSAVLSFILADYISYPIERVNKQAKMLSKGKYEATDSTVNYREIVELSETLTDAADELSRVDRMQKDLVANISHDLRTPLTMIVGYGEVMRDIQEENTPENMQVLIDEALRLSSFVDDLLELSKIQNGSREKKEEIFSFREEIEQIVTRYRHLKEHDGFTFTLEADEDEAFVLADKGMIGQIVYNLLNNAVHYSGDSREIALKCTVANGEVRLDVRDYGIGIAEEELPHIWERYYRAKQNHRRTVRGSGLGLFIVRELLELHKARYGVSSRLGEGTLFWFSLPLAQSPDEP